MLIRHHLLLLDLPRGRQTHPPWRPHFMRRRRTKEKPADCQGCRRARLCPVRGTHTKSASFKDSVAGLTGRYRTSLLVWLASFCLVEIALKVSPLPEAGLTALQRRINPPKVPLLHRRPSLSGARCRCGGLHMDAVDQCFLLAAATSFLILVGTLTLL